MDYIKTNLDIDMVCNAIAHIETSEDPYWDDMAETLLKAMYYSKGKKLKLWLDAKES